MMEYLFLFFFWKVDNYSTGQEIQSFDEIPNFINVFTKYRHWTLCSTNFTKFLIFTEYFKDKL
jgi:hypothetical protein